MAKIVSFAQKAPSPPSSGGDSRPRRDTWAAAAAASVASVASVVATDEDIYKDKADTDMNKAWACRRNGGRGERGERGESE